MDEKLLSNIERMHKKKNKYRSTLDEVLIVLIKANIKTSSINEAIRIIEECIGFTDEDRKIWYSKNVLEIDENVGGRLLQEIINPDCDHNNYLSYYEDEYYGKCISCDSCGQVAFVFVKEEKQRKIEVTLGWESVQASPSSIVRYKGDLYKIKEVLKEKEKMNREEEKKGAKKAHEECVHDYQVILKNNLRLYHCVLCGDEKRITLK